LSLLSPVRLPAGGLASPREERAVVCLWVLLVSAWMAVVCLLVLLVGVPELVLLVAAFSQRNHRSPLDHREDGSRSYLGRVLPRAHDALALGQRPVKWAWFRLLAVVLACPGTEEEARRLGEMVVRMPWD
jgi:hypothetical protein